MPSHHITMSDQELQLIDQVRIRMGLGTIDQTVEALAKSALARKPDCDTPDRQPGSQEGIAS